MKEVASSVCRFRAESGPEQRYVTINSYSSTANFQLQGLDEPEDFPLLL